MLKKLYSAILFVIGTLLGVLVFYITQMYLRTDRPANASLIEDNADLSMLILFILFFGLIMLIFAPAITHTGKKTTLSIGQDLEGVPTKKIVAGVLGVIIGFIIALLISLTYRAVLPGVFYVVVTLLLYIICGFLGFSVAVAKFRDSSSEGHGILDLLLRDHEECHGVPKVIDTSVAIDGRILDVMRAGFLEGNLIVPEFVLDELRHIADSSDSLKRVRGRRGLKVLEELREEFGVSVYSAAKTRNLDDIPEVDVKLVKLAKELGGALLTTDFNLNKVAVINDIQVLNINELANALKPIVIPGEKMMVHVVKQGKDPEQGIGYLDDGTMIVVEDGAESIGKNVMITVTSLIQTAAGKMIFGRVGAVEKTD